MDDTCDKFRIIAAFLLVLSLPIATPSAWSADKYRLGRLREFSVPHHLAAASFLECDIRSDIIVGTIRKEASVIGVIGRLGADNVISEIAMLNGVRSPRIHSSLRRIFWVSESGELVSTTHDGGEVSRSEVVSDRRFTPTSFHIADRVGFGSILSGNGKDITSHLYRLSLDSSGLDIGPLGQSMVYLSKSGALLCFGHKGSYANPSGPTAITKWIAKPEGSMSTQKTVGRVDQAFVAESINIEQTLIAGVVFSEDGRRMRLMELDGHNLINLNERDGGDVVADAFSPSFSSSLNDVLMVRLPYLSGQMVDASLNIVECQDNRTIGGSTYVLTKRDGRSKSGPGWSTCGRAAFWATISSDNLLQSITVQEVDVSDP